MAFQSAVYEERRHGIATYHVTSVAKSSGNNCSGNGIFLQSFLLSRLKSSSKPMPARPTIRANGLIEERCVAMYRRVWKKGARGIGMPSRCFSWDAEMRIAAAEVKPARTLSEMNRR